MNDLEIAKAIAELEGLSVTEHKGGILYPNNQGYMCVNGVTMEWYNPITDLALNCMLRDKYQVEVEYTLDIVFIHMASKTYRAKYKSKEDIPRAVCTCILGSQGRYLNEE